MRIWNKVPKVAKTLADELEEAAKGMI